MAAAVKTIPAGTVGKNRRRSNDILNLKNNPVVYSITSHEHFKPFSSKKAEPVLHPTLAVPGPKDMRYFKVDQSETKASYQHLPLPKIAPTPQKALHHSNIRMGTDPREGLYLTNHTEEFKPLNCQRRSPIHHPVEKLREGLLSTETTTKMTFIPHHISRPVIAKDKRLGIPPFKRDKQFHSYVSDYTMNFQGDQSRPAQSTKNHNISVPMGDRVRVAEKETSYAGSFSWPPACRPTEVKEHPKLILGTFPDHSWLSTSNEDFCPLKQCPVAVIEPNRNFSSLPEGDTDESRNRERRSLTTNRVTFSDVTPKERPVYVGGSELRAKSSVQFGEPCLSGQYYTTTANEHYSRRDGERAKPAVFLPSSILRGPDHGLTLSVTQSDYVPQRFSKPPPCASLHKSNVRFPQGDKCFSTTYRDEYIPKGLIQQPVHSRLANRLKIEF